MWQNLPPLLLYPILIPHIIKLCVRYKTTISIITKSNPAFPYGGLPFASKSKMSDLFSKHKEFLPYKLIEISSQFETKLNIAKNFVMEVNFPIIAKPNTSHRGIDVHLIKNQQELVQLLKTQKWDYILQKYCDYDYEYGIFYYRNPNNKKGEIISLSEKKIPIIIGNGNDNLKTLILNSNIDNKKPLLEKFSNETEKILANNERLKTMVCASHSRGAIFSNIQKEISQELIDKTDQICNIEGFYFGRLDVRAENLTELKKGNYQIIEVNGATSEFIHIYDKNYSFIEGISDLKKQWDFLFEISNQNRNIKENNISFYKFLNKYIKFFLLTRKVTGKLW